MPQRNLLTVLKWSLLGSAAFIVILLAYLWLVLLSPFGYEAPDDLPAIDETMNHRVFLYGTLRSPVVRWIVIGRSGDPLPMRLPGHRREGLDIVPEINNHTEGLVLEVTPEELRRLDRYERLGIRYERVDVLLEDGELAWVYRRLPEGELDIYQEQSP